MTTIHIIASEYLDDNLNQRVGGIESYIHLLTTALKEHYSITVYQPSNCKFNKEVSGANVIGLGKISLRNIVKNVEDSRLTTGDILLFSTDQFSCESGWGNTVVIQHGISWDLPTRLLSQRGIAKKFERAYRWFLVCKNHNRMRSFKNIVCVDYNYVNWYRTLSIDSELFKNIHVIPNCAGPQFYGLPQNHSNVDINICFARRFLELRGITIFLEIAETLLKRYSNITITFVGDGPQMICKKIETLKNKDTRVEMLKLAYTEMTSVYDKSNIVVIPSLASEGTSLTALEAMAMGKCVVASNVGGLTNIIIDGYNGYLLAPTTEAFVKKISALIESPEEIFKVGKVARHVAESAFNFGTWATRWREVMNKIAHH